MSDRRRESSDPPHIDADGVARHTFSSGFRGYDNDEVRAYLLALAEDIRSMNEHLSWLHVQLADAEQRATAHVQLDEDRLTALLGEETMRVLSTAREAATAIVARAEAESERKINETTEQTTAMRSDAMAEAIRHRERAEAAAMAEVEAAKAHGRQLITDAQALRERVLADLSRRRNAGRAQVEQLRAGRDRLLGAYEVVQRTLDHAVEQLRIAAPEAQPIAPSEARSLPSGFETAADEEDAPEGIRILTPPAPPVPPEPVPAPESPVVEEIVVEEIVVEEIVVVEVAATEVTTEEVTEETPITPGDPTIEESVDELFARIRAGRAEEVAKAEDVLAEDVLEEDVLAEPGDEPPADSLGAEGSLTDESAKETSVEDSVDVFDERAAALAPLEVSLARKLRRVLADDQNEVLDRLRQGSKLPDLETLVGSAAHHAARFADPARPDLGGAARAGAELVSHTTGGEPSELDDVVTDLGMAVTEPLRERLTACLTDSAGDLDEATELVRAAYREWKTQRIDAAVADALVAAFNRGAYSAAPVGCTLRWLVAPDQSPCPDADDNALAGEVARGTAFPTGHVHAPAHPGCRCQVVIAPR